MSRPISNIWKRFRSRRGQGLLEYALILVLVAIVVVTGLQALQGDLEGTMGDVYTTVGNATAGLSSHVPG